MAKVYCRKSILFFWCLVCFSAYGDEDNLPSYEYMQIFQSIPALFEYFLDVLEQRPEILERDDIAVFNRNLDEGTGIRERRSHDTDNRNDNGKIRASDSTTQNVLENGMGTKEAGAITIEYVDSYLAKDPLKRSTYRENIKNQRMKANEMESSNDLRNQLVETNGISGVDDRYNMYWGKTFLGYNNLFSLDYQPEDVVQRIILIDELLEQHNAKKA